MTCCDPNVLLVPQSVSNWSRVRIGLELNGCMTTSCMLYFCSTRKHHYTETIRNLWDELSWLIVAESGSPLLSSAMGPLFCRTPWELLPVIAPGMRSADAGGLHLSSNLAPALPMLPGARAMLQHFAEDFFPNTWDLRSLSKHVRTWNGLEKGLWQKWLRMTIRITIFTDWQKTNKSLGCGIMKHDIRRHLHGYWTIPNACPRAFLPWDLRCISSTRYCPRHSAGSFGLISCRFISRLYIDVLSLSFFVYFKLFQQTAVLKFQAIRFDNLMRFGRWWHVISRENRLEPASTSASSYAQTSRQAKSIYDQTCVAGCFMLQPDSEPSMQWFGWV